MRGRTWTLGLAAAVMGAVATVPARGLLAGADVDALAQAAQPAAGSWQESGDWTANARNRWRDDDRTPRIQLNLRTANGADRWGFGVRVTDLAGLPDAALDGDAADVRFTMPREAGTFTFTGSFIDGRGTGRYTFSPSAAYASAMNALGFRAMSREDVMRLAVMDVSTAFVKDIRGAGQAAIDLEELVRFKIHGVTGTNIRELAALGFKGLDADELVKMRIHGATPARIRELRAAGLPAGDPDDVVKLRIHNVTPEFIAGLKSRNYSGLIAEDYVTMRIHGVTLAEIDELKALGYSRPRPRRAGEVPHPRRAPGLHPRYARAWASPTPTSATW